MVILQTKGVGGELAHKKIVDINGPSQHHFPDDAHYSLGLGLSQYVSVTQRLVYC